MEFVIFGVGAVIVVAIALVAVGGGVAKTAAMPPQLIYDVQESIDFCAEALSDEVTSAVTYDELRIALRLHLEWIQAHHYTPTGEGKPVVFEDRDAVAYVMERAQIVQLDISREHMVQIMDAHNAYFQFMGAVHIDTDTEAVAKDLSDYGLTEALESAKRPELEE